MKQDELRIVKQLGNGKSQKKQDMQEGRLSSYAHAAIADRVRAALCGKLPSSCNNRTSGAVEDAEQNIV